MAAGGRHFLCGHASQMIAAAEALDRILRKPQPGGNRTISEALQTPETNFFLFSISHGIFASSQKSGPEGPPIQLLTRNLQNLPGINRVRSQAI